MAYKYRFRMAYKAKDIVHVYKVGPMSCMKGHTSVKAYEGPDLAVAYLLKRNDKGQDRVMARSVVWPDKKRYYRIYGRNDSARSAMKRALKKRGYEKKRLNGARLTCIRRFPKSALEVDWTGNISIHNFILPSVDGRNGFKIGNKYITIV